MKLVHTEGDTPYLFLPLPLQVDMEQSPFKRLLVAGAAGACKSYGARWLAYRESARIPGLQTLLLRCTFDELEKNHLKYIPKEVEALCANGIECKWSGGNRPKLLFENGALISMGYCDDNSDIDRQLGAEWDRIKLEEGNTLLPRALQEIPARDRGSFTAWRAPGEERDGSTLILANPGGRGARTLIEHYITKDPDPLDFPEYNASIHGFIHATLDDNPYLREDYASRNLSGLSAARYKQLRHGDWTSLVGQFFEAFDSSIHVTASEPA